MLKRAPLNVWNSNKYHFLYKSLNTLLKNINFTTTTTKTATTIDSYFPTSWHLYTIRDSFFYNLEVFLFHVCMVKLWKHNKTWVEFEPAIHDPQYARPLAYLHQVSHSVIISDPNFLLFRLCNMETLGNSTTGLQQFWKEFTLTRLKQN